MNFLDFQRFAAGENGQSAAKEPIPENGVQEDFETLIRGTYKAEFDARVQKILDGRLRQLRQENEALRQTSARQEQDYDHQIQRLAEEASAIAAVYPDFHWEQEMTDPGFARLIRSGVDGRTAYEVTHRREILRQAVRYGAVTARQQVARSLAGSAGRVEENGSGSVCTLRTDPSALTSTQLAEIRRRVQKGEKISF